MILIKSSAKFVERITAKMKIIIGRVVLIDLNGAELCGGVVENKKLHRRVVNFSGIRQKMKMMMMIKKSLMF